MIVPVSGKVIGVNEKQYMHEAVEDGHLTTGRWDDRFEKALREFIGVRHILTCNSGSSANLLALSALTSHKLGDRALKPGDEVITVAAGFPTTVNPILQLGMVPVFVDVTIPEYNIDVAQLEEAYSPKVKAVMIAHTLGNPFNVVRVKEFCDEHKLWLVEDCCDALGSTTKGKHVGLFGDIATLSFYPAHHITTGEGGAVFTDLPKLAKIVESFRDWGRDCFCAPGCDNTCKRRFDQTHGSLPSGYDHKYTYSHLGYNLKFTDIQAACGVAQMERLGGFIEKRRENWRYLWDGLADTFALILPLGNSGASPFGFPITIIEPGIRPALIKYLDNNGVGTRLLFGGNLTKQPYMIGRNYRVIGNLPVTDKIMNDTFWIGCHPALTREQLDHTIHCIRRFFDA